MPCTLRTPPGRLVISFATTGPGIATALSALKNAETEFYPLLMITPFKKNITYDDFQYFDIVDLGKKFVKYVFYVEHAKDFSKKLNEAYYIAKTKVIGVLFVFNPEVIPLPSIEYSIQPKK